MDIRKTAAVLMCIALAGCGAATQDTEDNTAPIQDTGAAETQQVQEDQTEQTGETAAAVTDGVYISEPAVSADTLTSAFSSRIDAHDFYIKLGSVQPGGAEVTEEVEVCGNTLHDVYKTAEGVVTSELFIVDGGIWSITNEGSAVPMYVGFDNNYDAHIRECVFHCINVNDGSLIETAGQNTETVKDQSGSAEFTYVYGDDGMLKSYDGCGAHYDVIEYREGIGEVKLTEELKAAIQERDNSVF